MNLHVLPEFRIVDESDDWLVVDKSAPLIVHPANRQSEPTLLCGVEKLLAYECENGMRPAIVNRLDRETSGLVIVAKHALAARELGMIFERRKVRKGYLAIVLGWPQEESWVNDSPILRAGELGASEIWVRQVVHADGKPCRTRFEVLRKWRTASGEFSLIRCMPETGRMHQIRVHLAADGHPIVGDKLYSGDGSEYLAWMAEGWNASLQQRLLLSRHALHAAELSLSWQGNHFCWTAPLPADMQAFLEGIDTGPDPDVVIWNRDS